MPVQVTLRSTKGGRVLAERDYASGRRVDAVGAWLAVVDGHGSVVAMHAACPGLECAVVEYASAVVSSEPAGEVEHEDGTRSSVLDSPPLLVADVRDDGDRFAEDLIEQLRRLGDEYGPLGVAIAAATLTDPQVLVRQIVDDHGGAEVLQGVRPPEEDATLVTYRREVDEQTARAEREHAARLRVERLLAAQQETTEHLRGLLDGERARAERAEGLVDRDAHPTSIEAPRTLDLRQHPLALRTYAPGLVTFDGRVLQIEYDGEGSVREGIVAGPFAPEPALGGEGHAGPHPIAEDPRRPSLDSWPDDAVLLTYRELRRLVSLHLERCSDSPELARAMLEGESPLRVSEVLDR